MENDKMQIVKNEKNEICSKVNKKINFTKMFKKHALKFCFRVIS